MNEKELRALSCEITESRWKVGVMRELFNVLTLDTHSNIDDQVRMFFGLTTLCDEILEQLAGVTDTISFRDRSVAEAGEEVR